MKVTNIAIKDFEVNIRTRRFQIIALLFIITSLGMIYSSKRLGISANLYETPFQMLFLSSFSNIFNYLISLSGILIGTTAISTELEKGTLRLIVSKPIHRDKVLLGKLLGGLLTLSITLSLFYTLTVVFALVLGVPLTRTDLIKFLVTLPFSLLYGLVFLNLGVLISIFAKKSKNAILLAVFTFLFFGFLLSIIAGVVAFAVAGLPPVPNIPENVTNLSEEQLEELFLKDPAYQSWLVGMATTAEKILYISPNYHYQEVIRMLFGGKPQISEVVSSLAYEESVVEDRPISESLSLIWQNILALMVMLLLPFPLAYTKFMKADLR
ncbi:ABC transporter permease [Thermococcus argininiproducens]|uniref:ABC transporter permease n=1 Tax=Thermococcus argininiproducens TaxID=2866384 RepID=A0A9E7MB19_9EURY|nr:ABC transporter permease [Thermococcus argininiproducens]USG99946.1 ABC transporter permease [Thermococcus argininiproducens]